MNNQIENSEDIVKHWLQSAERNYITMNNLLNSKDNSWALFMGHLVIEKTLKAIYVNKFEKHPIFTHDLLRLASKANITVSDEYEEWLDKVTTFNLNARYENYKQDFYKLCTKEFTNNWINKIKELRQWLINQL